MGGTAHQPSRPPMAARCEPGCSVEVGSLYNNPLHPSQTTDLPRAPERDSRERAESCSCYAAIAVAAL
eukprot:scaffold8759_cov135-Isochrysis_galbana.AAC.5